MLTVVFPQKLQIGDEVRVVAPSASFKIISKEVCIYGEQRLAEMGLKVSFGKNIGCCDNLFSSSVQERIDDLHDAYRDKNVKAIFTAIGGRNSHELLSCLDYVLIKNNPKFLLGYSDTTALQNAIFSKTGVATYYGPAFSTLGMKEGVEYSIEYLKRVLFEFSAISYTPSVTWSDDDLWWCLSQDNRTFQKNDGPTVINAGAASGHIVGGEMHTLRSLLGTEFMPSFSDAILALEITDVEAKDSVSVFEGILQSFMQQKDFGNVKGVIIGRNQQKLKLSVEDVFDVIKRHRELDGIPVICNIDFGHTYPMITLPIGGVVEIDTSKLQVFTIKQF